MQVILDSSFARPGSAPIWGGKKGEFRDWTSERVDSGHFPLWGVSAETDSGFIHQVQSKMAGSADEDSPFRDSHFNYINSYNSNAQSANTFATLFT